MADGFEEPDGLVVLRPEFLEDVRGDLVFFLAHVDAFADERAEHVEVRLERRRRIRFVDERAFDVFDRREFRHLSESPERYPAELAYAFGDEVDIFAEFVLPGSVEPVAFCEIGSYEVPVESPYFGIERVLGRENSEKLFVHGADISA